MHELREGVLPTDLAQCPVDRALSDWMARRKPLSRVHAAAGANGGQTAHGVFGEDVWGRSPRSIWSATRRIGGRRSVRRA